MGRSSGLVRSLLRTELALPSECMDGCLKSLPSVPYPATSSKAEAAARRTKALTAHLISPTAATGANFVMLLAKLGKGGSAGQPPKGVERC